MHHAAPRHTWQVDKGVHHTAPRHTRQVDKSVHHTAPRHTRQVDKGVHHNAPHHTRQVDKGVPHAAPAGHTRQVDKERIFAGMLNQSDFLFCLDHKYESTQGNEVKKIYQNSVFSFLYRGF